MEAKDPSPSDDEPLEPNSSAEEFFSKVNHDFRRPKPSEEAVAAALQAIQALAGDAVLEESVHAISERSAGGTQTDCPKCGGHNSSSNRFCGFCGTTLEQGAKSSGAPLRKALDGVEQHVHHHHHHHHYFPEVPRQGQEASQIAGFHPIVQSLSAGELPAPSGQDTVLRNLLQEWVLLCNAQRLDELVALYTGDAVLIRPGTPIARGREPIKDSLRAELDAGLGDVQLECTDVGTLGDVACVMGSARMLAPVSPANRQERTGKFLMVVRREGTNWGILADIWCLDAEQSVRTTTKTRK